MRLLPVLPLLLAAAAHAASGDEQDRELARWQEDIAKARQAYQAEVRKANDRTLKALTRIAQREARGGDLAGAAASWKAALAIDIDCGEAREFFTSLGRLDDVLGEIAMDRDPLGGGGDRPALVFSPGGLLAPTGNTLHSPFERRTVELLAGRITGDGVLFEEGDAKTGQAIAVEGDAVRYVVAVAGVATELRAAFDRASDWTHIAAQFDQGEISLWIDGKLGQRLKTANAIMPPHDQNGALGGERKGSVAQVAKSTLSFRLAMFRLSDAARFTTRFTPPRDAVTDKTTLLAIGSANLAEVAAKTPPKPPEPAKDAAAKDPKAKTAAKEADLGLRISAFANLPDANVSWTVVGDVFLR